METILHLSDLHFGWSGEAAAAARRTLCLENLVEVVGKQGAEWKPTVVVISGDLGWRGDAGDYLECATWLSGLLSNLSLKPDSLIMCPGNHDLDRRKSRFARPQQDQEADQILDVPVPEYLSSPFQAYTDFCDKIGAKPFECGKSSSQLFGVRDLRTLRFVCLNSAWFAKADDDEGKLWLGLPQLQQLAASRRIAPRAQRPTTIALMHHPPRWLHDTENRALPGRPNVVDFLARHSDLLLTGHTHAEIRPPDRIAQESLHFSAGATFAGAWHPNNFRLLRLTDGFVESRPFEFENGTKWGRRDAERVALTSVPAIAPERDVDLSRLR